MTLTTEQTVSRIAAPSTGAAYASRPGGAAHGEEIASALVPGEAGPPIRLLIADDHVLVREGIRLLLESQSDMRVLGEASNGREALTKAQRLRPDVVILDITMPEMSGLDVIGRLKELLPATRIVVLTMHDSDEYFFRVLNAGAAGYVVKGAATSELIAAVRAVHGGGAYLHPSLAQRLVDDYLQRSHSAESMDGLSKREQEVLELVVQGKSNREIADQLFITLSTVQTHRTHIMEKLNLHTRTDLVKYALRKGMITLDS